MNEPTLLQIALEAADAGNAGHWPTVAGILADEYRKKEKEAKELREAIQYAVWDKNKIMKNLTSTTKKIDDKSEVWIYFDVNKTNVDQILGEFKLVIDCALQTDPSLRIDLKIDPNLRTKI